MLPEVSKFTYNGVNRVVIEKGADPRPGAGLLTYQLEPEKGSRTFKPGKMMNRRKLGKIATILYFAKSIRIKVG